MRIEQPHPLLCTVVLARPVFLTRNRLLSIKVTITSLLATQARLILEEPAGY